MARKEIVTRFPATSRSRRGTPSIIRWCWRQCSEREDFSEHSRQLYQDLAATSPLVVVLGRDVPANLGGGVRGVELQPGDPLCEEWVVVTLGADTCRALVARELAGPARHDGDQRYEFLITSDRALVTRAARSLLNRVP